MGPHRDEMTIGERERETGETARTIRRQDSRDPCLGGAGAESDTKRETLESENLIFQ